MSARLLQVLSAAWLLSVAIAGTPAGTIIRGQATAVVDGQRYYSNEVESVVTAVCSVTVLPNGTAGAPGQIAGLGAGDSVRLPYLVVNSGNVTTRFTLAALVETGSEWHPSLVRFRRDDDRDGRADGNEPEVTELELRQDEMRNVLLEVFAPPGAEGSAFVSPVAACPRGTEDRDNTSELRAGGGPVLHLETAVDRPQAFPGDTVGFTTVLSNDGTAEVAHDVVLEDLLDEEGMAGLSYLPGSAHATAGRIEYSDGSGWTETEPQRVTALRVTVSGMEAGEELGLEFRARVDEDAPPGSRSNAAEAVSTYGRVRTLATLEVVPRREHLFGPSGNPDAWPGGEGSEDDTQVISRLDPGGLVCRPLALVNVGTGPDEYLLQSSPLPPGVDGAFQTLAGTPLPAPLPLRQGEETKVQFCVYREPVLEPVPAGFVAGAPSAIGGEEAGTAEAVQIDLFAVSLRTGRRNSTFLRVRLESDVAAPTLALAAFPETYLDSGAVVTYDLRIVNDTERPLVDAEVRFPLPRFRPVTELEPILVSASAGAVRDTPTGALTWGPERIEPGEARSMEVVLRMPPVDSEGRSFALPASFSLDSPELSAPAVSNEVVHLVPAQSLLLEMEVSPRVARVGDEVEVRVSLRNPTRHEVRANLSTTPPPRTSFLEGSAVVSVPGRARSPQPAAPEADGTGALDWNFTADELLLSPSGTGGDRLTVVYRLAILPGAAPPLVVLAAGGGMVNVGGRDLPLRSNSARATLELRPDAFNEPDAMLTGRVYLDGDGNGTFGEGTDTPLPGARVLLANGWQVVTDENGIYAFRGLEVGPWGVMLDRRSAAGGRPGDGAEETNRLVRVEGLTVLDFPLAPPGASVEALRSTRLVLGPVSLEKRHERTPDGVEVVIVVHAKEALEGLRLIDPLPGGGQRTFDLDGLTGSRELRYRLPAGSSLTDPELRWRDAYR